MKDVVNHTKTNSQKVKSNSLPGARPEKEIRPAAKKGVLRKGGACRTSSEQVPTRKSKAKKKDPNRPRGMA